MIVNVQSGSSGFAKYVIEGTDEKERDQEKIEIVGDPFLTEKIAEQQGTGYFKILVSPEKKLSNEEMHEILNEAIENIFVGFKKDEYTYSAVLHQDTEKSHWHIIVPKQNLLTNQQLRLYMHDIDTKRYKAIQDTIALNHNLLTMKESKKILADIKETTYEKNSIKPIQYTYNLSKSDDKKLAQQQVKELIKNNIDTVNSIEDIKELIHKNTDLKVVTDNGYNRKKDFHYITVQDKNNKKTSVRGELFNKDFFKQTKQEQRDQLQVNHKTYGEVEKELLKKKIKANLRRENEKRFKVVRNYGRSLKIGIRTQQREVNHQIRKEENDSTRTNVTESPERSREPASKRRRQQAPTLAKSALQIEAERIRTLEKVRSARAKLLRELTTAHRELQERHREHTADIQARNREYTENIRTEHERKHKSIAERFSTAIRTAISNTKEFISNFFKRKESANENNKVDKKIEKTHEQKQLEYIEDYLFSDPNAHKKAIEKITKNDFKNADERKKYIDHIEEKATNFYFERSFKATKTRQFERER